MNNPLPFFFRDSYYTDQRGYVQIPGHVPNQLDFVMILKRHSFRDDCTRGTLLVGEAAYETLEPVRRTDGKKPRCIPQGRYRVVLEKSDKFGMILPELKGVPDFDEAKLHIGNWAKDTEGCILVGKTGAANAVYKSEIALNEILKMLHEIADQGARLWIEIIEEDKETQG